MRKCTFITRRSLDDILREWKAAVASDNTRLGFGEWCEHQATSEHSESSYSREVLLQAAKTRQGKPGTIVIEYEDFKPRVKLPPGLWAKLKFVDITERETVVLRYKGLNIYQTIRKDMGAGGVILSDYWLAMETGVESDSSQAFDSRDLPLIPDAKKRYNRKAWNNQQQRLAYAIDQGWITADGADFSSAK